MALEKNIIGMRYGSLTVLSRVGSRNNAIYWNCVCDCGNSREAKGILLRKGEISSCGCKSNWKNEERKVKMTGQRFGRLLVIKESISSKPGQIKWKCLCDCGNEAVIDGKILRLGNTKSCGCFRREVSAKQQGYKNRLSVEFVVDKLRQNGYDLLSEYKGSDEKATLRCINCDLVFTRSVGTSLYDINGCPSCSKSLNGFIGSEYFAKNPEMKTKPCKLYLIEFEGNNEHFWKIGLTRQTIKQRLQKIPYDAKSITTIEKTMEEIYHIEKQIKGKYKHQRYLPKIAFSGHSECFKVAPELS